MATTSAGPMELNYGMDDVPKPFPKALGLGLQHVLTMFGATVAVPLLLGPAMGMDNVDLAILISSVFIASGIATILQLTIGSRLPIVQGVSFAFLGPFFAIIGANEGVAAMPVIGGAILVGAVVEAVIGFSGVFGLIRRYITPIVIGPVIALIGLSLFNAATLQVNTITGDDGAVILAGNWWIALLTAAFVFLFSLVLARRSRLVSVFSILLAVVCAYVVCLILSESGLLTEGNRAFVSFERIGQSFSDAPWVRNVVGERSLLFPWGAPSFDLGFFIAVLAAYMASMIESFGDYHAIARVAGIGEPTREQINRGIGSEGIGCFFTGLLGGFASTSYTENIGLIGLTRVASRYVVMVGAAALIVLGFVTKFGAIIATIPTPVVGGIYLTLFGLIAAVGLTNLQRADMTSQRNLLIVGFTLFMGLVGPDFMGQLPPDWTFLGTQWTTNLARSIFGSGIAVAAILGLFLDNVIPATDRERGITTESDPMTDSDDTTGGAA